MIKTAHECPTVMFEDVQQVTDYDYFLCHLLEEDSSYKQKMIDSVSSGRETVLDNSIFELGHSFDPDKFAYLVRLMKPTWYIVPDILEDYRGTVKSYQNFVTKYPKLEGKKIGVVQGKTYYELCFCYKELIELGVDKIAISFDYSWYESNRNEEPTKFHKWVKGRQEFLDMLVTESFFRRDVPIHLLGCGLPQEFSYYNQPRFSNIESLDTSNPVVHGLSLIHYNGTKGLEYKNSEKLFTLINRIPEVNEWVACLSNINQFRKIVNPLI